MLRVLVPHYRNCLSCHSEQLLNSFVGYASFYNVSCKLYIWTLHKIMMREHRVSNHFLRGNFPLWHTGDLLGVSQKWSLVSSSETIIVYWSFPIVSFRSIILFFIPSLGPKAPICSITSSIKTFSSQICEL